MSSTSFANDGRCQGGGEPARRLPRIVVIDSGIHAGSALVRARGRVVVGPAFADDGSAVAGGGADPLGHGTAVAAQILRQCGAAELIAVRVFDEELSCAFDRVLHALRWAIAQAPDLVNVSLGTTSPRFEAPLRAIVAEGSRAGVRFVAPAAREGMPAWPGMLDGVDGVVPDPNVPEVLPTRRTVAGRAFWFASPASPSLATATVTGYLARASSLPDTR